MSIAGAGGGAGDASSSGWFGGGSGWSTIGGSLISLGGGLLRNRSEEKAMHEQMDYQQMMANTAHQREIKDLKAAGLNPILSATGGGGAPTGSVPSPNYIDPTEGIASGFENMAKRQFQNPVVQAEVALKRAEEGLTAQKEKESISSENLNNQLNEKAFMDAGLSRDQAALTRVNTEIARSNAKKAEAIGNLYETGGSLGSYGKKLLQDASTLEPSHVLKGAWDTGKEYFNKAKDFIQKMAPESKIHKSPGDVYGTGKGNTYGGQHKAGQKVPWSEVEKQRGVQDNVYHPNNWRR